MTHIQLVGALLLLNSGLAIGQAKEARWGDLPLCFEQNLGQSEQGVRFIARGGGGTTSVTETALVFACQGESVRLTPLAGSLARVSGQGPLETRVHYQRGSDPADWIQDIPCFSQVYASEVWPGIDLVVYGNARRAEYDLIVAVGADASLVRFELDSAHPLLLAADGSLLSRAGSLALCPPIAYQVVDGGRVSVEAQFELEGNTLGFTLGNYDQSRELVIDPMWLYANLIGGAGRDMAWDIVTDSQGTSWVCGETFRAGTNVDAFVAKINPSGTQLVWMSILAGAGNETAFAIALEPTSGVTFIGGSTTSNLFPGVSASVFDNSLGGASDGFIAKLSASGILDRATYLGGNGDETIHGLTLETTTLTPFVTGFTTSAGMGFPTTGSALDRTQNGASDVFVSKLNSLLSSLTASTLIGGTGTDSGSDIQIVGGQLPVVCGTSNSAAFPGANNMVLNSLGGNDAFVLKLDATFGQISNARRVGGTGDDRASALAIDSQGTPFVAGFTNTTNLATVNAFQANHGGGWDSLIFGLNASMQNMLFLTYFGGTGSDSATDLLLDSAGRLVFTGNTDSTSPSLRTVNPLQGQNAGMFDGWLAHIFTATPSTLRFSTFFGTAGHDTGFGLGLDGAGLVYIGGYAGGAFSPSTNVNEFDQSFGGGSFDALAVRVSLN